MENKSNVLVIGGGVLGASLTYYLAKRGIKVTLLEKNEVCSGTSSTTAALVLPSPKTPAFYTEISWAGYERIKNLEKELERDFELQITGSTMLCRAAEKEEGMRKTVEINQALGKDVKWLDPDELVRVEPVLNPEAFLGGVHCTESGNLNPFLFTDAFIQKAKRLGARVETFAEVTGFEAENGMIRTVHSKKGDFTAEHVVLAAGNGNILLGKMLGVDAHIKNTRGMLMVSEKVPPILHSTYAEMRQAKSGNLIMGANFRVLETGNTDKMVHYDEMMEVAKDIAYLAPALSKIKIIRMYSGIRVLPKDGLPVAGKPGKYENLWFYHMHSAFSAAPEFSYRLSEILLGDETIDYLGEYEYARFEK